MFLLRLSSVPRGASQWLFPLLLVLFLCLTPAWALEGQFAGTDLDERQKTTEQSHDPGTPVDTAQQKTTERHFVRNLLSDQQAIWSAPTRLRAADSAWMAPIGVVAAGLIAGDRDIAHQFSMAPQRLSRSHDVANAGVASLVGAAGGLYLWGKFDGDVHREETGLLSAEAAINATGVAEALKLFTQRERPLDGNGQGRFWQGGSSFPSEHSMAAWSIASVIAHEYPGSLIRLLTYGAASAVSLSRVTGHDHFPSDVFIGDTLGWLIGRQVYRAHHDPDLPGARWGTFSHGYAERGIDPGRVPSSYVPLDSWVYPAFDRLQALGYAQSGVAGLRPWTRMECARLVREAGASITAEPIEPTAAPALYRALATEFEPELDRRYEEHRNDFVLESVYSRFTGISGTPLTDSFHFAQTTFNDFGRPYQEGGNVVTGVSSYATVGPLAIYVRGEYQHAPSAPALPASTRAAEASADNLPIADIPGGPIEATNRFRLLDSYVALNVENWQLSFGKQSLWWGPTRDGALQFSNNAEPVYMLRLSRVTPFKLPSVFGLLGPIRSESFLGQLQGHDLLRLGPNFQLVGSLGVPVDPQPYIWGQKINFHPTPNLEFGVSAVAIFAGYGRPLTFGTFEHTFSLHGNAQPVDPGKRTGEFDFSYRIPGLRNWLALYASSITWDEINPIAYPRRSAMNPGIYMPKLPGLAKLDLRVEGVYTDLPNLRGVGVYYTNAHYVDGYTNYGQIMGSWVGRQGWGVQGLSTYWLSPRSTLQVSFRKQLVNRDFLEGGDVRDFSARANLALRSDVQVMTSAQYERWAFPLLSPAAQSNVTMSLGLCWHPKWGVHR